jgi:hypothetical protein
MYPSYRTADGNRLFDQPSQQVPPASNDSAYLHDGLREVPVTTRRGSVTNNHRSQTREMPGKFGEAFRTAELVLE